MRFQKITDLFCSLGKIFHMMEHGVALSQPALSLFYGKRDFHV